ncbi:porin family protein [Marinobacter sp.]|uniref:porin family protein n=1 Tax=Marinobacter sp. TaxID=50741 RepID=UPI0034A370AA
MMNRSRSLVFGLATLTGSLAAAPALAQDMYKSGMGNLYAGLNYTFFNLEDDSADADVGALSGKVGVLATPYFGVEARAGFGVDDDRVGGIDYSVDNFFGGYATLNLANESPATPYVIVGFSRLELEAEGPLGTRTDDDSDLSYGVGVNVEMAPQVSGNLEYMRYYDKRDVTIDGLGVGVTFNF